MKRETKEELHVSKYIIIYKFILGIIELILGTGIIIFGKPILSIYRKYSVRELLEDPHDLLASILEKIIPYLTAHLGYLVVILLVLGVVKIVAAIGLFYKKHWGLDLLIILTMILLPFELYNLFLRPSPIKIVYFIVNILIALYLVNFKPQQYFSNLRKRFI